MLNTDIKSIKERGDKLFQNKRALDTVRQDLAENFYVERASFTSPLQMGDEYATHLMTSYPSLMRRQLGDAIGAMLRPKGKQWFHMNTALGSDKMSYSTKVWSEDAIGRMRRAMYSTKANFARATKEGDHDFASFGGCAISVEINRRDNALLYRNWHLRDMAWEEDSYGQICAIHRNWHLTVREMRSFFKKENLHPNTTKEHDKDLDRKICVRHVMVMAEEYPGLTNRHPWVSLYIDCENNHLVMKSGSWNQRYVLPRWATVSGSQYGYSPATVIALPDARLLQAMTLTLLDAGEIAVRPPMIGVGEAIRGDMQLYAGGFTSVDSEYDERLGEVLRPLNNDSRGLPYGFEMADRLSGALREVFYLNTLSLPPQTSAEMTAYEAGERVSEYIRQAIPLFEPMEDDYNGALCELTFDVMLHEGAFGPRDSIPREITGDGVGWSFESPLSESIERNKGQKFLEAKAIMAEAIAVDPTAVHTMDFQTALRDALSGIGAPITWQTDPEEAKAKADQEKDVQSSQQILQSMETGAGVVEKLGNVSEGFAA